MFGRPIDFNVWELQKGLNTSNIALWRKKVGTLSQCRSQKFQKSVKYLLEICQKTVSYKNQSENSKICVRYQS